MNEQSSAEFRKNYARLTVPTLVTSNGHAIGIWTPATAVMDPPEDPAVVDPRPVNAARMTQAERDAVLRRINRG